MNITRRPFKGAWFWEWQLGPVVFQVRHTQNPHFRFRRVHVWRDRFWRFQWR